jgi:uncharacterized protein YceK
MKFNLILVLVLSLIISGCATIQELVCQGYQPPFKYGAILGNPQEDFFKKDHKINELPSGPTCSN